ncbi:MAG TPA: histidine--tRNA ligase [Chthoniobacterales bacterium]|jgi:histidyl-tRNA synthetase|nr:histidine--tRNA ligase [Chthoniobacterales bacterium]
MQPLPGFRDFLPDDCAFRNAIFARWREVCRSYGFVEWEGPVLEPTELYKKKSGPEIVAQLFNFTDKGDREVALRPEVTPTLARVVAAHEREFRKPLKWFCIPQCFRYEKQQRGRLREHFQLNCDLIGDASPAADVEIVALAIDLLRGFGFSANDFVVRLSDRQFWTDLLEAQKVPGERWSELLQIIDKSEREPREKTAERLGPLAGPVFEVLEGGGRSEKLAALVRALEARGLADYAKIDLSVVRGLAYYTGVVFEVFDRAGELRAIAGGGRYDNLISQLSDGGVSLPAVGFAMGDVVLGDLIRETPPVFTRLADAISRQSALDVYLVVAKEERRAEALRQLQQLRDAGLRVDYPLTPTKVGKQFQTAEALGAKISLLYGDEWPAVKMKTLATREEVLVPNDELLTRVGGALSS